MDNQRGMSVFLEKVGEYGGLNCRNCLLVFGLSKSVRKLCKVHMTLTGGELWVYLGDHQGQSGADQIFMYIGLVV